MVVQLKTARRRGNDPDATAIPTELTELDGTLEPLFPGADPGERVYDLASYWVMTLPATRRAAGTLGHDIAYRLAGLRSVRSAAYEGAYGGFAPLASLLGDGSAPEDRQWSQKAVRLAPGDAAGGAGIVIGHPDTGWAAHPELDVAALDLDRQWNTLTDTADATDPQTFVAFNGHGTATATVMVSGGNPPDGVMGIAQGARVLPIRCIESVVLVLDVEVARAIWYASEQNVDVISMSLGGYPAPWLEGVMAHAIREKNIIFCAAAGNVSPAVVYPAAYPDCIAVAGTTPSDRPWNKSSYGPPVTISAPAHLVWVGDFDENRAPVPVKAGSGTSFAAPQVAAAAALWLERHGRQNLLDRYQDRASLQEVFKMMLTRTARNPGALPAPGRSDGDINHGLTYIWNTNDYGAGILNVEALLAAVLPSPDDASAVHRDDWAHTTYTEVMHDLFRGGEAAEAAIAASLEEAGQALEEGVAWVGAELSKVWMDMQQAAEDVGEWISGTAADIGNSVESAGKSVQEVAEILLATAEGAVAAAADSAVQAAAAATAAAEDATAAAAEAAAAAAAAAEQAAKDAVAAARAAAEAAAAAAAEAASAAAAAAEAAAASVGDAVEDAGQAVSDTFKSIFG